MSWTCVECIISCRLVNFLPLVFSHLRSKMLPQSELPSRSSAQAYSIKSISCCTLADIVSAWTNVTEGRVSQPSIATHGQGQMETMACDWELKAFVVNWLPPKINWNGTMGNWTIQHWTRKLIAKRPGIQFEWQTPNQLSI